MNTRKSGIIGLAFFLCIFGFAQVSRANDLAVSNVRLGPRDTNAKTLAVLFDLSWKNSWRNKINHDAVWVTVRLQDISGIEKKLCPMAVAGLNPAGSSGGSNAGIEVLVSSDKIGAFLRRSANHSPGDMATTSAMLSVNYDACGFNATSDVSAMVFALEMVYVPQGSFFAGDRAVSNAAFRQGSVDTNPWPVSSETAINVTGAASAAFYYTSAGNQGEFATGSSFTVPASFPKGYNGFYMMKYELTEGQWADFVNSLAPAARSRRDITNTDHKNSDSTVARNTVACSGSPLLCSSSRPFRAATFLSWPDLCAFLDWSGLRPMTELEFEKAARGPTLPVSGEYAWGASAITAAAVLSGSLEDGTELVTTAGANARFNNVSLSGGDSSIGPEGQQGPLRAGVFSTTASTRLSSGAGYYGAMELSGNVKEWTVTVGNAAGLAFTGVQGDGVLTSAAGFEGNASKAWPGLDPDAAHGVTSSMGAGSRGGAWADPAARLAVSDRTEAASGVSGAVSTSGGRGVRSAEGQ